jgi:hypothetical protein
MKTHELLTCDIRVLITKVDKLKFKDLTEHILRIAASLGEGDPRAMMRAMNQSFFGGATQPHGIREEMERIFDAIGERIAVTSDNMETVLRLVTLCHLWLSKGVALEARQRRLAKRGSTGRGADHGQAPDGREHQERVEAS